VTRSTLTSLAGLLTAVLLAVGCSPKSGSGGEGVVLTVATGFSQGMPATTSDVVDLGLPALHNISGHSVGLRGVSLVSVPNAVHVRSVTAYLYTSRNGAGLGIGHGDWQKYCRKRDMPQPVTDIVIPPHSDSKLFVVIAMTFARPGSYYLGRAKIYYTTNGQPGWQYQSLYTTIVITAARKDTKPAFDGC